MSLACGYVRTPVGSASFESISSPVGDLRRFKRISLEEFECFTRSANNRLAI